MYASPPGEPPPPNERFHGVNKRGPVAAAIIGDPACLPSTVHPDPDDDDDDDDDATSVLVPRHACGREGGNPAASLARSRYVILQRRWIQQHNTGLAACVLQQPQRPPPPLEFF